MKRFFSALIALLPLLAFAQEDFPSYYPLDYEGISEEVAATPFYPFSISGDYIWVSPATFHTPDVKGQELTYKQADVAFAYTQPLTEICGLIFGAGYVGTELNWRENPEFTETDFTYVSLSLGAFTKAFPEWFWTLTATMFIDTEELDLSEYALYQGVLFGKYTLNPCTKIDIGFILEIGLNKDKIWPILGFEITPCAKWKLMVVYPVDVSYEYFITDIWSVAASARFLRNRHRLEEDEPNPKGIFQYQTWGAELDAICKPFRRATVKGFAGYTFGGDLKVTNRNDKHGRHYKFNASYYLGVSGIFSY